MTTLEKAQEWANDPAFSLSDRQEIQNLIDQNNLKEIEERFYKDLSFGTGGLRAILGMGSNRLNLYQIRKATYAFAKVILSEKEAPYRVCLSYDSRHYSQEFAQEVASVFSACGIESLIYNKMNPVPLLSFAIRHHQADAGVMITASHNPPEYNGYKAYWSDGAQVTTPIDQAIIHQFSQIESFSSIPFQSFEQGLEKGEIKYIGEETEDVYFEHLKKRSLQTSLCQELGHELKIVYTPLHGTGLRPCGRILKELGFSQVTIVNEQAFPDGSFPTVKFPNPEDPEAMEKAVDLLLKEKAHLAFGTDPDTDRLGVVVNHHDQAIFLNGNQIGVLLLHYILTQLKDQDRLSSHAYFINTIVTSKLQTQIASSFGLDVYHTLTGFKWICRKMQEVEEANEKAQFVFATEESFGYLSHPMVRDKDGVDALSLVAEMGLWYKAQNKSLIDALDQIYEDYGFATEKLLSFNFEGKEGAQKISNIMKKFREEYKESFFDHKILIKEDYLEGTITQGQDIQKTSTPQSNVLGLQLENDLSLYLRPSGTEPKIKFYLMKQEKSGSLAEKKERANQALTQLEELIRKNL